MKYRKLLPSILKKWKNQKGQSLIEFVLLLTVISGISYGFVAVMNRNIIRYWEHSVNIIIDDKTQPPVKIR